MEAIELIDLIRPEHCRTSCSDDYLDNGFYTEEDGSVSKKYFPRCVRCALLEIESGLVDANDEGVKKYFSGW